MAVYFIQAGCGPVKIGFSAVPKFRIVKMQADSPVPLRFIGLFEGDRQHEASLHQQFADRRLAGEWFDASVADELASVMLPPLVDAVLAPDAMPEYGPAATFGELLKMRRKKQHHIAALLDVHVSLVSRWATRSIDIPTRHLQPIANFLGVPVVDVLAVAVSDAAAAEQ